MADEFDQFEPVKVPTVNPRLLTFYFPATPEETRKAGLNPKVEGGTQGGGRFGNVDLRNHTIEKYNPNDPESVVAVAMPGEPTGKRFPLNVNGRTVRAWNIDTGGGLTTGQIDVATSNPRLAKAAPIRGGAQAKDEWAGFEPVQLPKDETKPAAKPKVTRQPTEQEAVTAPQAIPEKPWYMRAWEAGKRGDYAGALNQVDEATQQGIRRALNLPIHRTPTSDELKQTANDAFNEAFKPAIDTTGLAPSRQTVEKALAVPGAGDLSKLPYATDLAQALSEMPSDIAGFMTSPGGVASLFTGGLPKMVQALVGAGFTAQQVYSAIQAPDNVSRIKNMLFAIGGISGTGAAMLKTKEAVAGAVKEIVPPPEPQTISRQFEVPTSAVVPSKGLFLEFAGEKHPVESIQDASRRFSEASDAAIIAQGTEGVPVQNRIVDANGKPVGRISPNGKVWDNEDNLVYDPRSQLEVMDFMGGNVPFKSDVGTFADDMDRIRRSEVKSEGDRPTTVPVGKWGIQQDYVSPDELQKATDDELLDRISQTNAIQKAIRGKQSKEPHDSLYRLNAANLYQEAKNRGLVADNPVLEEYLKTSPYKTTPEPDQGVVETDYSEADKARMQREYEEQLLDEAEQHLARGGDDIVSVVQRTGGFPTVDSPHAQGLAGELNALREEFKKGGFAKSGGVAYKDLFKKDAGSLDKLFQAVEQAGFDVNAREDVIDLVRQQLRTGKKIYGSEARAEALSGMLPESAFPQVGVIAGRLPIDTLWKWGQRLNEGRKGLVARIRARPTRDMVSAKYDQIDNHSAILGDHAGNEARLAVGGRKLELGLKALQGEHPLTMDEQAIIPVIEAWAGHEGAAGTPLFPITYDMARKKMIADATKVMNSPKADPALKRVYAHALNNFDRLAAKKGAIDTIHQRQLAAERAAGIDTDDVNGYVAHRFDMDLMTPGKPLILDSTGGRGGTSSYFMKQRTQPDYATAIAKGYKPRRFDIASLVNNRVRAGQYKINQRQWIEGLKNEVDPITAKPLVAELVKQPKGTLVAPPGYVTMEPVPGVKVGVNEYFAPLVRALTGESHFPAVLSKTEAGIKHGVLLFDTFHLSRLSQMQLARMGKVSYRRGLSLLEYNDAQLDDAIRNNEITQPMAEYARKNRPDLKQLVGHGLNAGQISDALFRDVVSSVPVVGDYTKFLFEKFNRGIIAETGLYNLEHNRKIHPEWPEEKLFRESAKETNIYYRNLRSQGLFKRKTWQDAMRFFTLAPQWYEGMITSELKGYGQLLRAPYDSVTKQRLVVGNIAQGMGKGILAYMVGTQLINMLTRGHPTWDNPEQGEKWSAWVPDFLGSSNGFFINPMGVFAEMTHDMMKYSHLYPNKIDVASKIIQNKFSPVSRALRDVFMGKDFFGRPLETVSERAMQAGIDLLPIPIGARSLSQQYAGSQERTLSSSLGLKLDVAPGAGQQIKVMARDFNREHGVPTHDPFPSQYRDLTTALRDGDMDKAKLEYEKLRKTKSKLKLRQYYDKLGHSTFTGSKKRESQFRRGLDRDQIGIYNQAVEDAKILRQRFYQLER